MGKSVRVARNYRVHSCRLLVGRGKDGGGGVDDVRCARASFPKRDIQVGRRRCAGVCDGRCAGILDEGLPNRVHCIFVRSICVILTELMVDDGSTMMGNVAVVMANGMMTTLAFISRRSKPLSSLYTWSLFT